MWLFIDLHVSNRQTPSQYGATYENMTSQDVLPQTEELGEWPRSLSLLEKMFAVAVQGDVAMFNAVAHVCQKVLDAKGVAV